MAIPAAPSATARTAFVGVAFALLAAIGFSAKAIFVKLAYLDRADAVTLLALRMALSAPFFIGVAVWARLRHETPLSGRDWGLVVALGLLGYYLSSLLDFLGLQYISAGLERLILFLYPTLTVILAALLYRMPVGRKVIAAIALSYGGIMLVFLQHAGTREGDSIALGSFLVFLSTLTYSGYLIGAGHAIARIGAMRFTAYASIVASVACLAQFAIVRPWSALDLPLRVYELSLAMAVFSTVLPVFLLSYAIRGIGSGSASLIGSIGPVSTIYMAYVFLGERLTPVQIGGSLLVLIGVVMVSLSTKRAGKA